MSKDKETIDSLLSTLTFLESIGAGDPISETADPKDTLTMTSARDITTSVQRHHKNTAPQKPTTVLSPPSSVQFSDPKTKPMNTDHVHKVHLQVQEFKALQTTPLQKHSDILQQAKELAAQASTLDDLQLALSSFEGCLLKKTATHTVFADGNPRADIMLVGEAPGADEDRQGLPFVGRSGQLLDKMLSVIGLSRQKDYYISNIIPWRPPGNRPPTPEETAICLPFIQRHIQLKQPKYLICIGGTAAKSLLQTKDSMGSLRGKWFDYDPLEGTESSQDVSSSSVIPTTVLFHPSYLLRSPGQKRLAWADLQKISAYFLQP